MCNVNRYLIGLLFWRSHFIMIRFSSVERDYSLSKGLRSQHGKGIQQHDSLGSPRRSKRTSYNFF